MNSGWSRSKLAPLVLVLGALGPVVAESFAERALASGSSYWMAELDVGPALGAAFPETPTGLRYGVTLGAGGAPAGTDLRIHLILQVGHQTLGASDLSRIERTGLERSVVEVSAGLRMGSLLGPRFRLFGELGFGHAFVATEATLGGGAEVLAQRDDSFLLRLAAGAQFRLHSLVSLGARMDVGFVTGLMAFDPLAEMAGADGTAQGAALMDWVLTLTFHL